MVALFALLLRYIKLSMTVYNNSGLWQIGKKQGSKGRQPFGGARGILAPSHLPAAEGGNLGRCHSPVQ